MIEPDADNKNGLIISSLGFVNKNENLETNNIRAVLSVLKLHSWLTLKLPEPKEGREIDHKQVDIEDEDDVFIKPHF